MTRYDSTEDRVSHKDVSKTTLKYILMYRKYPQFSGGLTPEALCNWLNHGVNRGNSPVAPRDLRHLALQVISHHGNRYIDLKDDVRDMRVSELERERRRIRHA